MEMIGLLGLAAFNTTFMSLNTVSPGGPHTKPRSARCTRLLLRTCRRPLATCNWHLCKGQRLAAWRTFLPPHS